MKSSWNPSVSNSQSEFFCVPILSVCFVKTSLGFHFTFLTGLLGLNPCANTHLYLIIYQPHENYYINLFVKFICSLIKKKNVYLYFLNIISKWSLGDFFLSRSDILSYVWERFFQNTEKIIQRELNTKLWLVTMCLKLSWFHFPHFYHCFDC